MPDLWKCFYSYSHQDERLRDELAKFLRPLVQQGRIREWYDRKIEPGLRWESAISDELRSADLILLLVSADFLASDYCFGVEMEGNRPLKAVLRFDNEAGLALGVKALAGIYETDCSWTRDGNYLDVAFVSFVLRI